MTLNPGFTFSTELESDKIRRHPLTTGPISEEAKAAAREEIAKLKATGWFDSH